MKHVLVVGSGAGGASVARDLQGEFQVTVLEAGGPFRRLNLDLPVIERLRNTGLAGEALVRAVYPTVRIRHSGDMLLVNGVGLGGTTTICTGNGLRMDGDLRALGIDLDEEFAALYREIAISTAHEARWHDHTRRLFAICREQGLNPRATPKMGHYERCAGCGRCIFGCPAGVKWDSRTYLLEAAGKGAQVLTGRTVERVVVENGRVAGVVVRQGLSRQVYRADLVVLAAGGFGTPSILQASGLTCEPCLSVDPVLTVAAMLPGAAQAREIPMPFVVQRDHYIVSPYFDYVAYLFNSAWRRPAADIAGLMIKLADSAEGTVEGSTIHKQLTGLDRKRLDEAVGLCKELLVRLGARESEIFMGTVNAGHPGGMLPLTAHEAVTLHHERLPENLWVADATLLPKALGNPPILTILALSKRIAKVIASNCC